MSLRSSRLGFKSRPGRSISPGAATAVFTVRPPMRHGYRSQDDATKTFTLKEASTYLRVDLVNLVSASVSR